MEGGDFGDSFGFDNDNQDNILLDGGDAVHHMGDFVRGPSVTLPPKQTFLPGFPLREIEADTDALPYLHDWNSPGWPTKVNAEKYRDLILSKIIYEGLRELSIDSAPSDRNNRIITAILEAHKMGGRLTSKTQKPLFVKIRKNAVADAVDASARGLIAPKQLPLELVLYILELGVDDPVVDTTTLPVVNPTTHSLNKFT